MKVVWRLGAAFLVTALAVLVPRLAWNVFDTYVLGHVDFKLGASGSVAFVVFLSLIAGFIAGVVAALLTLASENSRYRLRLSSALVSGLVLSVASFWLPDLAVYGFGYSLFGEIGMIIVNWAVISAAVLLLVQAAMGGVLPPNSRFPSDARKTARAGEAGR